MQPDTVNLTIRLSAFPAITRPDLDVAQLASSKVGLTKTLVIPAFVQRTGMATKLLIQGPLGPRNRKTDRSLLRLIGQAHRYRTMLDAADSYATMSEVAKGAGVSQSYFARVLRLNFLAPEITKMVTAREAAS